MEDSDEEEVHQGGEDHSLIAHRKGWGGAGGGMRPAGPAWISTSRPDAPKRFPRMSSQAPDPKLWHEKQEVRIISQACDDVVQAALVNKP